MPSLNAASCLPSDVPVWLSAARAGSAEALGQLLQSSRSYLLSVAERCLDHALRSKITAADVVQETFTDAVRDFHGFTSSTEEEWLAWLRCLLHHNLASLARRYRQTKKRQISREIPLDEVPDSVLDHTPQHLTAPEEALHSREDAEALNHALQQLPDHYHTVIVLHHWDMLSFAEIGHRLGFSEGAARKQWVRAIDQLHALLQPLYYG